MAKTCPFMGCDACDMREIPFHRGTVLCGAHTVGLSLPPQPGIFGRSWSLSGLFDRVYRIGRAMGLRNRMRPGTAVHSHYPHLRRNELLLASVPLPTKGSFAPPLPKPYRRGPAGGCVEPRKSERIRAARGSYPERSGDDRTLNSGCARKYRKRTSVWMSFSVFASTRRGSNPRPPPWQGGAPPLSHSCILYRLAPVMKV